MALNPEEHARIAAVIARTRSSVHDFLAVQSHRRKAFAPGLRKLAAAWAELDLEAKEAVRWWLAERAGCQPEELDVGAAALELADELKGKQGQRLGPLPLREAVRELFAVWVERGHPAEVGNLQRDRDSEREPYPACQFIAGELLELFPEEFARTRSAERRLHQAQTKADSQLRGLAAKGELRS